MTDPTKARTPALPSRLVAVNVVLLAALAVLTIASLQSPAGAQPGAAAQPAARSRGDYTMVSGRYQGGTASGVYIVDGANQEVLGLAWNRTRSEFEPIGLRSMLEDGRSAAAPR